MPSREDPNDLVGTFRRFGETGPIYEIVRVRGEEGLADVVMPESQERATVALAPIMDDPKIA